ncbi:MAG: DUF4124 domain-containing protein [Gammaproteobacteria bacterium]
MKYRIGKVLVDSSMDRISYSQGLRAVSKALMFLSFLLFSATASSAGVYKWVDEEGKTHYSDVPPSGKSAQHLKGGPQMPQSVPAEAQDRLHKIQEQLNSWQEQREQRSKERHDRALLDARKVTTGEIKVLAREFPGDWSPDLDLEERCMQQYGKHCDELLNWKVRAVQQCNESRHFDCGNESYLEKMYKPRSNEEMRREGIQTRARWKIAP